MEQAVQSETTAPESLAITQISHPLATIWLARENKEKASYFYGGTRLIEPTASDSAVTDTLIRLMHGESATKNRLINRAIESGTLNDMKAELPEGFLESRVGGARCIIRPHTPEIASRLSDPLHPDNTQATATVLESIGGTLNEREPRIKLTPDFGRYAGLADVLHQYTPNVLGIRCERGGCGGKSSYSTTGVLAGAEQIMPRLYQPFPVTLIGSAGAMGEGVLEYFLRQKTADLAACDLVYDEPGGETVPEGAQHLPSRWGMFTDSCLERAGLIVATTVGDELENSNWQLIPRGTGFLLAHNLALPKGEEGIGLARALAKQGVLVLPGQALTLGGALTARVEWYWRQKPGNPDFNKPLAHKVVHRVVSYLVGQMLEISDAEGITPYEAMLRIADEDTVV